MLKFLAKHLKKQIRAILLLILPVGVFTCLQCQALAARSVTLAWNPSVDPTVAGYSVYWGTASGEYTDKLDVGASTTALISGLVEGTTYYFVVTAHTVSGLESDPSNEASYTVPGILLSLKQYYLDGFQNSFALVSAGRLPAQWTLEASDDLITWKTLTTGTNSVANVTVIVCNQPENFFQLLGANGGYFLAPRAALTNVFPNSFHVTPANKSFFLLSTNGGDSLAPQTAPTNAFPNSVYVTSANALLSSWVLQASPDYSTWSVLAAGTNSAVNVAVIASPVPVVFFRLRGE